MAVLYVQHYFQGLDNDGNPLAGGKLYTYAAGTTTPKATYTTAAASVANTNPIILDSAGRATLFIDGSYKFVLNDSSDNLVEETDNVTSFTATGSAASAYQEEFTGDGVTTAFTTNTDLGTDEKLIMVFGQKEYVTNGTFAADSDWTKGAGWSIGSGVATATGAISTALSQTSALTLVQGKAYLVKATITRSAGSITPNVGGTAGTARSASGTYSEIIVAGSTQTIEFTTSSFTGTVDNVTVTRIDEINLYSPSDYTINGTTLTFATPPAIGTIQVWAPALNAAAASAAAAAAATSEANAATSEALAEDWASKTDGIVDSTDYSSKAWAIGGTGVTNNDGAAKEWATKAEDSTVDGTLFSALHYAAKAADSATTAASEATTATNAVKNIINYTFSTTTAMADPGVGFIRLNNASPASATAIAIDDQTAQTGNPNISDWLVTWDDSSSVVKGVLRIAEENDPNTFAIYNVSALTDNSGWVQLTVAHIDSNGTFSNNDSVFIEFLRNGDAGTTFSAADITGQTSATIAAADSIVFSDADDSGALKKDTVEGVFEAVNGLTSATAAATDILLINDADDSNAAKKVTAQSIADLAGGGAWTFISSQSASNDATIDFTSFINDTDFDDYVFIYDNVLPATDGTEFRMRASIDNGSNFLTTNEYTFARTTATTSSIVQNSGTGGDRFELADTSLGNAANEGTSGQLFLHKPSATRNTMVHANAVAYNTSGAITRVATGGEIITTSAVNAIRFYMASGNIASGDFRLYGIKKA